MAKKLSHKQQLFVDLYNGNATETAKLAGYSENSACIIGHENLRKPNIVSAIKKRQGKRVAGPISTREERLEALTKIGRDLEEQTRDRLRALELAGKIEGDYIERIEANVVLTPRQILTTVEERRNKNVVDYDDEDDE